MGKQTEDKDQIIADLTAKLQEVRDTLMLRDQEILNLKKEVEKLTEQIWNE